MAKPKKQEPRGAAAKAALPEAGDARRDELKRRTAELEAQAEELAAELDVQGIDPAKLSSDAVEREVRQAVNDQGEVRVSNPQPGYAYCWVFRDPFNKFGGRSVYSMQAMGWERVAGEMKEAIEHRAVTGERWVADCLLMRCPLERFVQLQMISRKKRLAQQEGISSSLIEKASRRGIRVRDARTDEKLRALAGIPEDVGVYKNVPTSKQLRQQFARSVAREVTTQQLKDGTAGLGVPGDRR